MTLLDKPEVRQVLDEVVDQDCYRIEEVPMNSAVIDVGAFYGEFGIFCAKSRQCRVFAYEPSEINFDILCENFDLNALDDACEAYNVGVTGMTGREKFSHWHDHPGGSGFRDIENAKATIVDTISMTEVVEMVLKECPNQHITVKLDCEGSEQEIFKDESWIQHVGIVTMEWHNYDGHVYREILERHGFNVELEGGGPKPRPKYDASIAGGMLFAKRKS